MAGQASSAPLHLADYVWRGDQLAAPASPGRPTGYAALDAVLPGGGWPVGALTELLLPHAGVGELSLLLPVLERIPVGRWGVCIAPPALPYAPALAAAGVPLGRLLVVQAESAAHARWACRQALDSRSCELIILWLTDADMAALRRLQLAAEASTTPVILIRPETCAGQPSPAVLRLALAARPGGLQLRLLKRRGPLLATPIELDLPWSVPGGRPDSPLPSQAAAAPSLSSVATLHALVRPRPARSGPAGLHAGTR